MKFTSVVAVLSAIAAVAVAQTLPPQCALSCLQSTPTNGCNPSDAACLCKNAKFVADQSACITAACTNPSDLQQAEAFAQANCLAAGVTLTATPAATGTASGGTSSATTPATTSASTSGSTAPAPTPSGAASTLSASVALLAGIAACALAL